MTETPGVAAGLQSRPHGGNLADNVYGMSDVNSWDVDGGQHLLSELETHCAAINDCGAQLLESMTGLVPDSPSGTEWLGRLEAQMQGIAQATRTVTAQVAQTGECMTQDDQNAASRMCGTNG